MKTLDRYLCASFFWALAGVFFVVGLVVLIAEVRNVYGDILTHQPDLKWVVVYLALVIPGRLAEVLPLATAMAALWVLVRLARHNEMMAFFCGGLSPARLSLPFLCSAGALSLALLIGNETVLPRTEEEANRIFAVYVKNQGNLYMSPRAGRLYQKGTGRRYYSMDRFIQGSQEMIRPTVLELQPDSSRPLMRLEALRAVQTSPARAGASWRFYDVYVWRFNEQGRPISMKHSDQIDMTLEKDLTTFLSQPGKPNAMGFLDLLEFIRARRSRGLQVSDLLTELHLKLAFPLAPLVVTLLVCSFTIRPQVGKMFIQFGGGIVLVLAYYAVTLMLRKVGHRALIPAELAAWAPNLIFLLLGGQWFARHSNFRLFQLQTR